MSESPDDIRKRMGQVRRNMGDDVAGIVDSAKAFTESAKSLTDWRRHLRRHPLVCLGAAAALGFLLAPNRSKRAARASLDHAEMKELIALLEKHNLNATAAPRAASGGLLGTLAGMAAPLVMRAAMDYGQQLVNELGRKREASVPGDDEFAAREDVRQEFNKPR